MNDFNVAEEAQALLSGQPAKQQEFIAKDIYTAEELFNMKITEVPFLWQNLIPQTGLCCLTGSSDCNKSTLLRQLAMAISLGKDSFLGLKLNPKHQKVIYVSTEDDANSIAAYISKQYPGNDIVEARKNISFLFNTDKYIYRLNEMLAQQKGDVVIIDTWTDLFTGDINQSNKVRANFDQFMHLSRKHGCAFIFVHHQGKSSEGNAPSKNNLLGSQGIEAKMRTVIELRRDKDKGNIRLMTITKGNYTSDKIKGKPFVLELDEEKMLFQRQNEAESLNTNYGFSDLKKKYSKDDILKVAMPLRAKGLSFEKILSQLTKQFGKDTPGITTLKTWLKGQSGSQLPSK